MKSASHNVTELRVDRKSYVMLCGPWVGLALFGGFVAFERPQTDAWIASLIPIAIASGIWLWLNNLRIDLRCGVLVYHNGFFKTIEVMLDEVDAVHQSSRSLVLGLLNKESVVINLKPFRFTDVAKLKSELKRELAERDKAAGEEQRREAGNDVG
ncbi:hypothetical protein [Roseimicrobium sp. ORNL1]|uniref:hypothetical protein n=1 Tax=Roseimicrobium sp. ORNL1 TaxID=2711231 RepID=UPI0013E1AF64|nr:hypothetical protein [Roseimicrobium sp. ORNL1]QIF02041.1 hypothetical protein G5S37_11020 [Roseimicrobium sp. ORNL1]